MLDIDELTPVRTTGARQLYFTPTYACNSDCIMCGVAKWKRDSRQAFTMERCRHLIDEMNLQPRDVLEFSGGEPTIYKGFGEIARYAKGTYNANVVVLSHGRSLKSEKFVKSLVGSGIDRFIIPLFSDDPKLHDYITQAPGSFEQTCAGFENLEAYGFDYTIKFIAMRPNHSHALRTYRLKSERFRKARFIISGYQLMGEAITNAEDVSVAHSKVKPSVAEVLAAAAEVGETVPVFMFPMCLVDPVYWPSYGIGVWREEVVAPDQLQITESTSLNYEEKPAKCENCALKYRCTWAWRKYLEWFGDEELQPYILESQCAQP